jgi:F-type H+-transporting ATPase subunit delta
MYRTTSSVWKLSSSLFRNRLFLSTAADGSESAKMVLNFCLPHETIYRDAEVSQVILPGVDGEYGVTVNHVPTVSQLKPGVVQVLFKTGEPEKYFIAGGFALTHPNSVTVRSSFHPFLNYQ